MVMEKVVRKKPSPQDTGTRGSFSQRLPGQGQEYKYNHYNVDAAVNKETP